MISILWTKIADMEIHIFKISLSSLEQNVHIIKMHTHMEMQTNCSCEYSSLVEWYFVKIVKVTTV